MFIKKLFTLPMFEGEGTQAGGAGEGQSTEGTTQQETASKQTSNENMIPKTRFDEVNTKYKELSDKVAEFERLQAEAKANQEAAELQAKKEQGKFEELYLNAQKELETIKKYESRSKELETLIDGMVKTKLETVPQEFHDLIPANMTAELTLDWLSKAESKGLFAKAEAKEIGQPSNRSEAPKVEKSTLTALEKIMSGLGK